MVDVNDTGNVEGRVDRLLERIETADITEADRAALREYATWKRRRAASANTARLYISAVLYSAERHAGPVTAVSDVTDVDRIIDAHEAAGRTAAKSINSVLDGLRDFWRWCDGTSHGVDDYRWVDRVSNVEPSDSNPGPELLDPDLILGESEIATLVSAADNYRDKAFIEFLCDTGSRITLATQLTCACVSLDAHPPTFHPNPSGRAHKDVATKEYILRESAEPIKRYLDESHPDPHPDAPLFALRRGYDPDARSEGALAYRSATAALTKAAREAGIDTECVQPHNLRKTAVARMRLKHGLSWDAIQKRTDWSDQSLPRMKAIYRRLDNSEEIDMVAKELGYGEEATVEELDAEVGQALRVLAGKDKKAVLAWLERSK